MPSSVASLGSRCQLSSISWPFLMIRCIYALLERVDANTAEGVEETLFFGAALDIDLDDLVDNISHVRFGERWTEDLRQAGATASAAAEGHLIELLTFLVHPEDADMADVVVTAGVHATGDIQVDIADVEQVIQVVKTALNGFGNRDRLGVGQRAEVAARAADDIGQQTDVRRGETVFTQLAPQGEQLRLLNIREDDVLVMAVAHFAKAVAVGQVGNRIKLLVGDIARRHAGWLERQSHGDIAWLLVRESVALTPAGKAWVFGIQGSQSGILILEGFVAWVDKVRGNASHFSFGQGGRAVFQVGPLRIHALGEHFRGQRLDQNLDARLVLVITTAVAVVHTQDGVEVTDQVLPRQEFVDKAADDRGPAQAATNGHTEAQLTGVVLDRFQADVVHFNRGTVADCAVYGNLELARQVGELRVEGRPLTNDLAPRTWADDFILGHTSELVGGGVTDAIAAGLDRVHLHGGQLGKNVRHIFQVWPVELDVLTGADVRVTLVVVTGNLGHHAHLGGRHQTVRHGNAQHARKALDVQAILQAQRAEFFTAQFTGKVTAGLIAILLDAVFDDFLVVLVVYVHGVSCYQAFYSYQRARPRTPCGAGGRYQLRVIRKSDV